MSFEFDVVGTRRAIYTELRRSGYEARGLDDRTPTQSILDKVREQAETGKGKVGYAFVRSRIYSLLDRFEQASAEGAIALPGVREALAELKRSSLLGVVTNSGRRAAVSVLQRNGLLDFFDLLLTRDEVSAMKPRPDGILQAIAVLGISKKDSLYVGDSIYDVMAARGAGVLVASVSSGNYDQTRLSDERPDYLMGSLTDLVGILSAHPARQRSRTTKPRDPHGARKASLGTRIQE